MSLDAEDGPGEHERTMVVDTRQLKRPSPAGKPWKPHVFKQVVYMLRPPNTCSSRSLRTRQLTRCSWEDTSDPNAK